MSKSRPITGLRGAVLALSGASACGVLAGLDDYAAGEAPPRIAFSLADCEACVARECPLELAECQGEAECLEQASCLFGCDDGECSHGCFGAYRFSQAAKNLVACQVDRCHPSSCGTCGSNFAAQGANCSRCVEEDAAFGICERNLECLANDDCRAYLACQARECQELGVGDPKCRMLCARRNPEAARSFYQTVGTLYFLSCREPCNAGKHWECEQPPPWPPITGTTAAITLRLPSPDPGVPVRACRLDDSSCTPPFAEGRTDPTGAVTLQGIQQAGTPIVYFEVHGPRPYLFVPYQGVAGDLTLWANDGWIPSDQVLEDMMKVRDEKLVDGTGGIVILVADCVGGFADFRSTSPEITVESTPQSKPYYSTDPQLDAGGTATLVNLPPGMVSLRVSRRGVEKPIELARVPVREGMFTFVTFNYPQWI